VEVEHIGMLPYAGYLDMLRSLAPAIMVCPLEMRSDTSTQDFVDGKSDVKILEALATGMVGVFSAARPYVDSDLPRPIICDNTYRSWFDGLSRARRACTQQQAAPKLPTSRLASEGGVRPFFEALSRVRLPRPIPVNEFADRLTLIRNRVALPSSMEKFDEEFYMSRYPDIKGALETASIKSAKEHFIKFGQSEGRMAFSGDIGGPNGQQWWANLMGTVNDLKVSVVNRQRQIDELKTRRSMRARLRKTDRR
jgi:hypothetical protein